jgi:hypothetical protein
MTDKPKKKPGRPKGVKGKSKANATSFKKGDVNNPKGMPKADHTLRDIIRARGPEVGKILFDWVLDENKSMEDRIKVMDRILDRGWGKVPTPIDTPEGGNNGQVTLLFSGTDANL